LTKTLILFNSPKLTLLESNKDAFGFLYMDSTPFEVGEFVSVTEFVPDGIGSKMVTHWGRIIARDAFPDGIKGYGYTCERTKQ
jgi:hypothetical protein